MATSDITTCYRHDDRRAGVVCQRCDRPICPDCMRSAAVGFHCPRCAQEGTAPTRKAMRKVQRQQAPYVAIVMIALSAVVFILDLVWTVNVPIGRGRMISEGVLGWEGQLYGPNVANGDWWRPITVGFVHGNVMHVFLNMLLLYLLAQLVEPLMGHLRFFAAYAVSLLGGSLAILLIDPEARTVGASGAVFGIMAAGFVGLRSQGIDPFKTGIGPLLVMNLIGTFIIPNVSVSGHIGGLLAGAFAGGVLFELGPRIQGGQQVATLICLGTAAVLFYLCLVLAEPVPFQVLPSAFDLI